MASLILGLIGLIAWALPLAGFPVTIVGLVLGVKAKKRGDTRIIVTIGIVLCIIGLVATTVNSVIGAYMGFTGALAL